MKKTFITTLLCTILLISCSPECETSFPVTPQEKKSLAYKSKTENKAPTSKEKEVTTHESKFSWDNASVYFAIIDRFYNSDPGREMAYGREKGNPTNKNDCGKFYGGNIAGLTEKLDYLYELGINAIWISAPYEQIHGWCVGSNGAFKHYSYHGYYVLDYTNMDANIGTKEEFKTFVDEAHSRGIRVVMDVVMSHAGYNTIEDAKHLFPGVLKEDFKNAKLSDYHDYIDYPSHEWNNWWTGKWVKARLGGDYTEDENKAINKELPQFITDSQDTVEIPPFLKAKYNLEKKSYEKPYYPYKDYRYEDYRIVELQDSQNHTVRDYLTDWLSKWVEEFGIDGFRCDSAKNVSKVTWKKLKDKCVNSYNTWKSRNSTNNVSKDNLEFWMTGEHFDHGVAKDSYYTDGGFDSMINFDFRPKVKAAVNYGSASSMNSTYEEYAGKINNDSTFNVLSYISSHDT